MEETFNTLKYATRVRYIKNKLIVNTDPIVYNTRHLIIKLIKYVFICRGKCFNNINCFSNSFNSNIKPHPSNQNF